MIARNLNSYRHRRTFRKYYYWALLVIFLFCILHSKALIRGKKTSSESTPAPRSPGILLEAVREIKEYSQHNAHHPHSNLKAMGNPEYLHSLASPNPDIQALKDTRVSSESSVEIDSAIKPQVITEDDAEYQDFDDLEEIGEHHHNKKKERSEKLAHLDDDTISDIVFPEQEDDDKNASANDKSQAQDLLGAKQTSSEQLVLGKDKYEDMENDIELPIHAESPKNNQDYVEVADEQMPSSGSYRFPSWNECQEVKEKADVLPDLLYVPFEDSVKDFELQGWEDEWIATAKYSGPKLKEPKIDFVYNWINGSQRELRDTMKPYELNSSLNDAEGLWITSHGSNRYREWNELRYSMRSVEKYAGNFTNRIQILVNAVKSSATAGVESTAYGKQRPQWLRTDIDKVQVLSQEEFFGPDERKCLPSFDSLTIENQLYNTKSEVDRLFALSDDMILGKPHSASDIYSPLFGPTLGFKSNAYNTLLPPTEKDAERFGEKPFLIYTSWLLNRRFGARKRKGQVHFGHSLSRNIAKEAITSFPRPAMRSASQRFRGETGFQLYSWYVIFHYTMERHREALLWSYIMLRSDEDGDGYLDWKERQNILEDLARGMNNDSPEAFRRRIYYTVDSHLSQAGLEPPIVNTDILWTSLDGPVMIQDLDCDSFDTEDCLAPGFSTPSSDAKARSPVFSSATILDRVARESPRCGDCLIKLILNQERAGLGPMLPHPVHKQKQRETVIKALMKFQYMVVDPDAMFYMVTDAEQAEHILVNPYIKKNKKVGQMCLNDDVVITDEQELERLGEVMSKLFEGLLPEASSYEA